MSAEPTKNKDDSSMLKHIADGMRSRKTGASKDFESTGGEKWLRTNRLLSRRPCIWAVDAAAQLATCKRQVQASTTLCDSNKHMEGVALR